MAMTGDPDRSRAEQRGAGSEQEPGGRSSSAEGTCLSPEAIDRRTGSIRAPDLGGVQAVDGAGLRALHSLERRIAADGGHVTLLNEPERGVD